MLYYVVRFAAYALLAYATACVSVVILQRSLIYIPTQGASAPEAFGLPGVVVEMLETADGARLETWKWQGSSDKPVIVFFHGNAGNLEDRFDTFQMFRDLGYGFVALDYRGYGNSTGSPSYATIISDAQLVLDKTVESADFLGRKVVLYGESLGTGVASELATLRQVAGIILQSPYTSIAAAASERFPWLPVGLLLTERFSNLDHVGKTDTPLLILHGDQDELFPVSMAQAVFEAAAGRRQIEILRGIGHNDIYPRDIEDAVKGFVDSL